MIVPSTNLLAMLALLPGFTFAAPFSPSGLTRRRGDAQSSLTLDPGVVMNGLKSDGQTGPDVTAGQVRSLTSSNNFINFCLTQKVPLTNGVQEKDGSCNQTPMGRIVGTKQMPSSKFVFPENFSDTLQEGKAFEIKMAINKVQTGNFVNPATNYYAAPQQVNGDGQVIGHSHVTVEKISDFKTKTPLDPNVFAFFKGLNGAAAGGILSAPVDKGLPAGSYRMCSINAAANHQPILVAVAQHGSIDDCVYFSVKAGSGGAASAPPSAKLPAKPPAPPAGNLNKFTGKLGADPISIVAKNGQFFVDNALLPNLETAIVRACNTQRNKCADKGNATKFTKGVTIQACDAQNKTCQKQQAKN